MDPGQGRPAPPPVPEGLTPKEQRDFLKQHGQAHNLQHKTAGAYLYGTTAGAVSDNLSPQAHDLLVKNVLEGAGATEDPIEQMLVEQIVIAHHTIGRLHMQSAGADNVEMAEVYSNAAVKLLGEFRRCVLALKKYREPMAPKNIMYVKQQNVAEEQQVAFVDGQVAGAASCNGDTQQVRKELAYEPTVHFVAESEACREWEREPVPTNPRRTRTAAAGRLGQSTVAAINRAKDARGQSPGGAQRQEEASGRDVRAGEAKGESGGSPLDGGDGRLS